jgi:hypothetical protein
VVVTAVGSLGVRNRCSGSRLHRLAVSRWPHLYLGSHPHTGLRFRVTRTSTPASKGQGLASPNRPQCNHGSHHASGPTTTLARILAQASQLKRLALDPPVSASERLALKIRPHAGGGSQTCFGPIRVLARNRENRVWCGGLNLFLPFLHLLLSEPLLEHLVPVVVFFSAVELR